MKLIHPRGKASIRRSGDECVVVSSFAAEWLVLFPQHGRGPKHLRPMTLLPWQLKIVHENTVAFLRGLMESDGCRYDRVVGGKVYPAYEFSNRSADIMEMCEVACSRLGVRFTRPSGHQLAVARRADVASRCAHWAEDSRLTPCPPVRRTGEDRSADWRTPALQVYGRRALSDRTISAIPAARSRDERQAGSAASARAATSRAMPSRAASSYGSNFSFAAARSSSLTVPFGRSKW